MRYLLALFLALSVPAVAVAAEPDPVAEKKQKVAELEAARDAARLKYNTYGLPQYRQEAEAKQKEIDALLAEIAALEKKQ